MVLDSLAGAEVVQLEQLPDLDFAILVMGLGHRLIHSIVSASDLHCKIQ